MDIVLVPLLTVLYYAIDFYIWALIISAVLSWLVAFNIVNTHNRAVAMIGEFLWRITDPALRPIRRFIPAINGLDLSPLLLIFLLWFLQGVIARASLLAATL